MMQLFIVFIFIGLIDQYSGSGYFKITSNSVQLQHPSQRFPVTGGSTCSNCTGCLYANSCLGYDPTGKSGPINTKECSQAGGVVCSEYKYSMSNVGQLCNPSDEILTDLDECKLAAKRLSLTFRTKQNKSDFPRGCYVWSPTGMVSFNTNNNGRKHVLTQQICKSKEVDKGTFVFGAKGSAICSKGNQITDETTCIEACRTMNLPLGEILGNHECYKDEQGKCYQNGRQGTRSSLLCDTSEQIPGSQVSCGAHYATTCSKCPWSHGRYHGSSYCNGDCVWYNNACTKDISGYKKLTKRTCSADSRYTWSYYSTIDEAIFHCNALDTCQGVLRFDCESPTIPEGDNFVLCPTGSTFMDSSNQLKYWDSCIYQKSKDGELGSRAPSDYLHIWSPNSETVLRYKSSNLTSLLQDNKQLHGFRIPFPVHIVADVKVQAFKDQTLRVKLEHIKFYSTNDELSMNDAHQILDRMSSGIGYILHGVQDFKTSIEEPMLIFIKKGRATSMLVSKNEPDCATQIKKALANALMQNGKPQNLQVVKKNAIIKPFRISSNPKKINLIMN